MPASTRVIERMWFELCALAGINAPPGVAAFPQQEVNLPRTPARSERASAYWLRPEVFRPGRIGRPIAITEEGIFKNVRARRRPAPRVPARRCCV